MNMVRAFAVLLLLTTSFVLLGSCSGGGNSGPSGNGSLPKPLAEQYKIDGVVDLSTLPTTTQRTIDMKDSFGGGVSVGTTTLRYAMASDERHLYIT